jgi:hypothetical protein
MRKKTAKTNECVGRCIRDERRETGRGGEVHILRCAPPRSLREAEAGMAVAVKERGVGAQTRVRAIAMRLERGRRHEHALHAKPQAHHDTDTTTQIKKVV